jgi:hypothetical protein
MRPERHRAPTIQGFRTSFDATAHSFSVTLVLSDLVPLCLSDLATIPWRVCIYFPGAFTLRPQIQHETIAIIMFMASCAPHLLAIVIAGCPGQAGPVRLSIPSGARYWAGTSGQVTKASCSVSVSLNPATWPCKIVTHSALDRTSTATRLGVLDQRLVGCVAT